MADRFDPFDSGKPLRFSSAAEEALSNVLQGANAKLAVPFKVGQLEGKIQPHFGWTGHLDNTEVFAESPLNPNWSIRGGGVLNPNVPDRVYFEASRRLPHGYLNITGEKTQQQRPQVRGSLQFNWGR